MHAVQAPLLEQTVQALEVPASQQRPSQSLLVHCPSEAHVVPSAFFGEQFSLAT